MFSTEAMVLVGILVGITAIGSYWAAKMHFLEVGIEIGAELTIDTLVSEGFLEVTIDSDGDEALVTIKEIKGRYK